MTVITISRELGSGGGTVAKQVAAALGYRYVSKSTFEKVLHQYGLIRLDETYKTAPSLWARLDYANLELVMMLDKVIQGIARRGDVVLLGRGGYAALHSFADVLHVRVQAPFAARVQTIMAREGLSSVAAAEERVARSDRSRAMFVQGYYDVDYYDTRHFQLVLDAGLVGVETAVSWILTAAEGMAAPPQAGPLTTQIAVDPVLENAIDQVLPAA